jgi:hypothetical protein
MLSGKATSIYDTERSELCTIELLIYLYDKYIITDPETCYYTSEPYRVESVPYHATGVVACFRVCNSRHFVYLKFHIK